MGDVDELVEELTDLREELTTIRATVRALTAQTTQTNPDNDAGGGVEPVFESAQAWVDAQFVALAATHAPSWCPHWPQHVGANARITELWRSWEHANHLAKTDLTAMEEWFRNVFDHHQPILLDRDGPFADCGNGHGEHVAPPLTPTDLGGGYDLAAAEATAELFFARSGQDYHPQPEGTM